MHAAQVVALAHRLTHIGIDFLLLVLVALVSLLRTGPGAHHVEVVCLLAFGD